MCAKKKRRFIPMECNHVYQRGASGFNIFYDREDFLVCYMILSVVARKRNVKILEICFMFDHVHILLESQSCEDMAAFIRDYASVFVQEYNSSIGREGQLFHKSFGSAPKQGGKKMRSIIVYIGNNPVEKELCRYAEDYRWNFLRYMVSPHPFSVNVPARKRSRRLTRCMKYVGAVAQSGNYLNYRQLHNLFEGLSVEETEFMTDYIIMKYYPFDDSKLLSFYDDWQQMADAMHSTAGSEHDILEQWYHRPDDIYVKMADYIKEHFDISPLRRVTVLPLSQKKALLAQLRVNVGATLHEACKFLHLNFDQQTKY